MALLACFKQTGRFRSSFVIRFWPLLRPRLFSVAFNCLRTSRARGKSARPWPPVAGDDMMPSDNLASRRAALSNFFLALAIRSDLPPAAVETWSLSLARLWETRCTQLMVLCVLPSFGIRAAYHSNVFFWPRVGRDGPLIVSFTPRWVLGPPPWWNTSRSTYLDLFSVITALSVAGWFCCFVLRAGNAW